MRRWRHQSHGRGCFGARGHALPFDARGFVQIEVLGEVAPVLDGSPDWALEDDGIPSAEEIAALEAEAVRLEAEAERLEAEAASESVTEAAPEPHRNAAPKPKSGKGKRS